MAFIRQ